MVIYRVFHGIHSGIIREIHSGVLRGIHSGVTMVKFTCVPGGVAAVAGRVAGNSAVRGHIPPPLRTPYIHPLRPSLLENNIFIISIFSRTIQRHNVGLKHDGYRSPIRKNNLF